MPQELKLWFKVGTTPYLAYILAMCFMFNRIVVIGGFVVCTCWLVVSFAATVQARMVHAATEHLLTHGTWQDLEQARHRCARNCMAWTAGALTPMLGITGPIGLTFYVLVPVYGLLGRRVHEHAEFLVTRQEKLEPPVTAGP
jgi:hypothetical protein